MSEKEQLPESAHQPDTDSVKNSPDPDKLTPEQQMLNNIMDQAMSKI